MYGSWPQSHVICCDRYVAPPPPVVEVVRPGSAQAMLDKHEPEEITSKIKGAESTPELDSAALSPGSI